MTAPCKAGDVEVDAAEGLTNLAIYESRLDQQADMFGDGCVVVLLILETLGSVPRRHGLDVKQDASNQIKVSLHKSILKHES